MRPIPLGCVCVLTVGSVFLTHPLCVALLSSTHPRESPAQSGWLHYAPAKQSQRLRATPLLVQLKHQKHSLRCLPLTPAKPHREWASTPLANFQIGLDFWFCLLSKHVFIKRDGWLLPGSRGKPWAKRTFVRFKQRHKCPWVSFQRRWSATNELSLGHRNMAASARYTQHWQVCLCAKKTNKKKTT